MKIKKNLINTAIVIASSLIGLLLCEVLARNFLNPVDYLSVKMIRHEILGAVVETKTSGFDEWGFRNRAVPSKADIVALGDSHTYGNTAKMVESWPYVLGCLSKKKVYNMGLGGYGPNQYYYLLMNKALVLKPKIIVCGIYMGDDFENAFSITYGIDYWSFLRRENYKDVNPYIWDKTAVSTPTWHKKIRRWLSRHSLIYRLVFHGPLLGKIKGNYQIEHASQLYDGGVSLINDDRNIKEAFLPGHLVSRLDPEDKRIKEGMRITFDLLKEMNEKCAQKYIQFVVVIIPTKEMVFSKFIEHNSKLPLNETINTLLNNERRVRKKLYQFLENNKISYVDTLLALRSKIKEKLYCQSGIDMHPNKNGYKVIAEEVYRSIKKD